MDARNDETQPLLTGTPDGRSTNDNADAETGTHSGRSALAAFGHAAGEALAASQAYIRRLLLTHTRAVHAAAALAVSLVVLVLTLHYVYLPIRLQAGALDTVAPNTSTPLQVHSLSILDISGAAVIFNLSAGQPIGEQPPSTMNISPTRFSFVSLGSVPFPIPKESSWFRLPRVLNSWTYEDAFLDVTPTESLFGLQFDGLIVPPRTPVVNFTLLSQVDGFNETWLDSQLTESVYYAIDRLNYDERLKAGVPLKPEPIVPAAITIRQQSAPTYWFPIFPSWKWDIPMWQYTHIDLSPPETPVEQPSLIKLLNITVDSQNIEMVPVRVPDSPLPVLTYVIDISISLTNPTPLRIPNSLGTAVLVTVGHNGTDILRIRLPIPKVQEGRNTGVAIEVKSVAENGGTGALMDWFGAYAAGENTVLRIHKIGFEYGVKIGDGVGRMGWIEEMVGRWDFEIFVKGAVEEAERDGLNFIGSKLKSFVGPAVWKALKIFG
ncbi:hypothetical protein HK100_000075 [Physocladia obscura]|uniref:Uncharacterized protein n=1 Tax=Physocladia obscura TaxID=109957 RepID=A0AAD5XC33_9FUNG|nr:hypothetical protein HK100_000075 [Physocladia obscura]